MTALAIRSLAFEEHSLRGMLRDELLWLVAKDVCDALGLGNHRQAIKVLDADDRDDVQISDAIGRTQQTTIISEGGVYTLAVRCQDAMREGTVAWRFRRWLTREVIPSLRRTGRYELPGVRTDDDASMEEISREADRLMERRQKLVELKEIRLVFGPRAARRAWLRSGLIEDDLVAEPGLAPVGLLANLHRSVADWLDARTEAAPGARVPSQELYADYIDWGRQEGLSGDRLLSFISFGKVLTNCGIGTIKSDRMYRVGLKLME